MAEHYGIQTAAGHLTVAAESKEPYAGDVLASLHADAEQVIARYPQKRSALLPLLHLVQSVDGYVTGRGIDFCAEVLDLSTAEVSGVATFYTQYKRHPNGEYTVGVCTNTLCAIMGGDRIWDTVSEHLGIGHDETTADGLVTLERVECNAACDYAPVVMANWEFFDNQTPDSTIQLVDDLRAGKDVRPSRGPDKVCTFKQVSRTLAGFSDGLADQGVGAGPASLIGLELAHANGWTAPGAAAPETHDEQPAEAEAPPVEDKAEDQPPAQDKTDDQPPAQDKAEDQPPAQDKAEDQPPAQDKADDVVPHDADAEPPTTAPEQSAKDAADGERPVEASEKPEAHAEASSTPVEDEVPVEGTPAIVADIDTGHVDQPAAEQAAVTGVPLPVTVDPVVTPDEPQPEPADPSATLITQVPPPAPAEVPAPAEPAELPAPAEPAEVPAPAEPVEVPAPAEPAEVPAPVEPASTESDVDEATVARINLVARGAAGSPAYEDDEEAGATVSRADLLAGTPAEKATDRGSHADGGHGDGSALPAADGSGPVGWDVKGNGSSMLFHTPQSPWYKRTKAEVWFRDAAAAAAAGFTDALDRRRQGQAEQTDGKDD